MNELLLHRRLMMQHGVTSRLPEELKEVRGFIVTSLGSNRMAYIKIEKNLDSTVGIKMNVIVNNSQFSYLFSCEYDYKTKAIVLSPGANAKTLLYDTSFNPAITFDTTDEFLHVQVIKNNYKNNQKVIAEIDGYATREVDLPSIQYYKAVTYFYLFAYTGNGDFRTYSISSIIGEIEITEGTEVTHILVPAMVKSSYGGFVAGEYGYYDLIDETFHNFTINGSPIIEVLT